MRRLRPVTERRQIVASLSNIEVKLQENTAAMRENREENARVQDYVKEMVEIMRGWDEREKERHALEMAHMKENHELEMKLKKERLQALQRKRDNQ